MPAAGHFVLEHGDELGIELDSGLVVATLFHSLELAEADVVVKGSKWMLGAGGYSGLETGPEWMGLDKGSKELGGTELGADSDGAKGMSVDGSL